MISNYCQLSTPAGWTDTRVGKVAEIVGGGTPSTNQPQFWNGDVSWATPTDITSLQTAQITTTAKSLTSTGVKNSGARILPANSLLMTSRATIGACAINAIPMCTNQGFASLVPGPNILIEFLYYLMTARVGELSRLASGSTFIELPKSELRRLRIMLPSLDEQVGIVGMLGAVDAAIDATRGVIEQTRRLKTAVLQDLLTRGLPGRHSEFQEVYRLGSIPKAWAVTSLRRLAEIQQGIALGPHREPKHSPVPYLRVANVQSGWIDLSEVKDIEATDAERDRYALQVDDVLIVEGHANINDLGRAALVDEQSMRLVFQNHLFRLRADRTRLDPRFLVYWINSHAGRDYFRIFGGTTSGLNTVGAGQIGSLKFPTPPIEEQEAIAELVQAIDHRLDSAQRDCLQLRRAKIALSQALLTGRVRVPANAMEAV